MQLFSEIAQNLFFVSFLRIFWLWELCLHLIMFSLSFSVFCFNREMKCEGIQGIRRLAKHHPDVLSLHLHTVTLAVIAEVSNVN